MRIKPVFMLAIALVMISQAAQAAQVSLAWDPSPSEGIAGYKVYVGTSSGTYTAPITIGNQTTYTVTGLRGPAVFYFAVTAFNLEGNESDFSNEVSAAIEAGTEPPGLHIPQIPAISPAITWRAVTAIGTTTATIAWQTDQECSGLVFYGTTEAQLESKVSNNQGTTDHLVNLTGLTPRTRYVYRMRSVCGTITLESPTYVFNTKVQ